MRTSFDQDLYNQINQFPLLTKEEEIELSKIIHESNDEAAIKEAKNKFFCSNLKLVYKIAVSYYYKEYDSMDLFQEGVIGLSTAIDKFDYKMDCKFSTYAVWWIEQAIKKSIKRSERSIRLPDNVYEKVNQIKLFKAEYYNQYHKFPDNKIISKECNISESDLLILNDHMNSNISLDQSVGDDGDDTYTLADMIADDRISPESEIINDDCNREINDILNKLTDQERKIIICRFGLNGNNPKTIDELAEELHIRRDRIRNIERIALKKLRRFSYETDLKIYKEE